MKYVIILFLINGERRTIPATRFSVPTIKQVREIEEGTKTADNPTGCWVYNWYRVKK